MKGIDCATPLTVETAKTIAATGMKFICRYLVPNTPSMAWKRLTKQEAEAITTAGLNIISVFETSANRSTGGAAAGKADGALALKEALEIGQPKGTVIYFAVDYDAQPKDYSVIEQYLGAAASVLVDYNIGVYGSFNVVEEMARRGVVNNFWQTYAWSQGKKSQYVNIYQYKNDQALAGINVDFNESYGNEGWWNTKFKEEILSMFKDIIGHYAAGDIEWLAKEGLVSGYKDNKFYPDKPTTRAESAVFMRRTIEYVLNKVGVSTQK
ncbi:S-layer homology domain-containing protein [Desulfotomaculum arcticum]|uniref:S-layer homology domain-containing protein n=1 Tax=Desulfotruncus arcticus DSM 17038 TaxID=1121424 RepID=A0A1I2Y782_9FIRM|nr:glycoside hydrolase domain-containing protein [Desulfotruncus arcticus]SFH21618.1 S-layer homology domain-containing protein [Desulfotomaculum arcticum] [Desulfotruncus arcticus DSM 17038]